MEALWIGTGAGLAHLINHQLVLYQKNDSWAIEEIYEDRDGKIWLSVFGPTTRHTRFAR